MNRAIPAILLLPSIAIAVACASTREPAPAPAMTVQVRSEPNPAVVAYRGEEVGVTPVSFGVSSFDDLLEIDATSSGAVAVEKRVRVLGGDEVEMVFQFDPEAALMARALGLARITIFDYSDRTTFDTDRHELKPEFLPMIERQAEVLNTAFAGLDVHVCGHTDSTGEDDFNRVLSVERARSVAEALETYGVARERLIPQGFGKDYPLAPNSAADGRAVNRRTEVILPR